MLKKKYILISNWNVNSIRTRLEHIDSWIKKSNPDIILLQEIKATKDNFPFKEFEDKGYNCEIAGQKSYNGVAIIAKKSISSVNSTLPVIGNDEARYIEAIVDDKIKVASAYIPNGENITTNKYFYKIKWLEMLDNYIKNNISDEIPFIVGGDFNIALQKEDVYNEWAWKNSILCTKLEKYLLNKILLNKLCDTVRDRNPSGSLRGRKIFSWWNYKRKCWNTNSGLRIDYLLANKSAFERMQKAYISTQSRKWLRPSDHTIVNCIVKV